MATVDFLSRMTVNEAKKAIGGFSHDYANDWRKWQNEYQIGLYSRDLVSSLGIILRKWKATRPNPMRRPQCEARHLPPYLDDLVRDAQPHLRVVATLTTRNITSATKTERDALGALWGVFENLPYRGRASCVGISKAVLLLTRGNVGPALDSMVRGNLAIPRPSSGDEWVECLCRISKDIFLFEIRNGITINSLVSDYLAPIEIGRVYDMLAGPRQGQSESTENGV